MFVHSSLCISQTTELDKMCICGLTLALVPSNNVCESVIVVLKEGHELGQSRNWRKERRDGGAWKACQMRVWLVNRANHRLIRLDQKRNDRAIWATTFVIGWNPLHTTNFRLIKRSRWRGTSSIVTELFLYAAPLHLGRSSCHTYYSTYCVNKTRMPCPRV